MSDNILLQQALEYAGRGWHVLPCRPQTILGENGKERFKTKAPLIEGGFKNASANPDTIRKWWGQWPDALIGVSTGPSGLLVVDLDNKGDVDGEAIFAEVAAAHGGIPRTYSVKTQSGGKHLYFKRPEGVDVPSPNGWLPNVDVRASSGYVIAPPSRVIGGGAYTVEDLRAIEEAPPWLVEALNNPYWSDRPKGEKKPFSGHATPYALAVLKGELEAVATCPAGCRNATLNTCAFRLWGWVAGGELAEEEVQAGLEAAAQACGLGQVETLKTIASAKRAGMEHPRNTPDKKGNPSDTSDLLPRGFSKKKGGSLPGLWYTEPAKHEDDDPVETWIGSPLEVLGETRDDESDNWGLFLEWHDADNQKHQLVVSKTMLVGRDRSAVLSALAAGGWRFSASQKAQNLFYRFLTEYSTKRRVRLVDKLGWYGRNFVFPDSYARFSAFLSDVSDVSNDSAKLQPSDKEKSCRTLSDVSDVSGGEIVVLQGYTQKNVFQTGGTLQGWQESIGTWSRGNSRVVLYISAALSSLLQVFLDNLESQGLHLVGRSTGGKSTTLFCAASVYGRGRRGDYVMTWAATANGLEGVAARHNDTAVCLDEISMAPAKTVVNAAYLLANGVGKARARADGTARKAQSWRCVILSTGEKTLEEKILEDGDTPQAGQLVRLVDVPADAGRGMGVFEDLHGMADAKTFAQALSGAAITHYGHLARAFIAKIQEHFEGIPDSIRKSMQDLRPFMCPPDASAQVMRAADRFLLAAVAGSMAQEWGLVPWTPEEAFDAAKTCFDAWLDARGGMDAAENRSVVRNVLTFIERKGLACFQDLDDKNHMCLDRYGFRRRVPGGMEYLFLPESFPKVCGRNAKEAAKVLSQNGLLLPGEGRNMMRRSPVDLPGYGRARCYTVFMKEEKANAE